MAHLVSPLSYRLGKTFFWSNSSVSFNNEDYLTRDVNTIINLSSLSNMFLRRHNYYVIHNSVNLNSISGVYNIHLIYYPMISPLSRKRLFPLYTSFRRIIGYSNQTSLFNKLLKHLWVLRMVEFNSRFISARQKIHLNRWLTQIIFRGASYLSLRGKSSSTVNILLKQRFKCYRLKKYWYRRWQISSSKLDQYWFSRLLYKRLGLRSRLNLINVFRYLSLKFGRLRFRTHQKHIWREYHHFKKMYSSFYDVVHAFYIFCMFPNAEKFLISMLQYSLVKMHYRKIKPKRFFYFIDAVLKKLPQMSLYFHVCRITLTGKLKGGTARTGAFTAGFGELPRQTLSKNIKSNFGELRSKYGSFGIKIVTWRKRSPFKI